MTNETSATKRPSSRIDELDGLRGILALWVAVVHIISWCGLTPLAFPVWGMFKRLWIESAQDAVNVFIILSGFVISYLIHSQRPSYGRFMIGRFFRIYPVYLICLLLGFFSIGSVSFLLQHAPWHTHPDFQDWMSATALAQADQPIPHLLAHLTLLFGLIPEKILPAAAYTLLGPAWSITLEWQYYLIAPLLARLVFYRAGWLLLAAIMAGGFVFSHFWTGSFLPMQIQWFLIGIGSFHLYTNETLRQTNPRHLTFAVIIIGAAAVAVSWHGIALCVWAVVLGSLLLTASAAVPADGYTRFLTGWRCRLNRPGLQWLGKISYPVYLVHWPVIVFLLAGMLRFQPSLSPVLALGILFVIGLPAILLAAWLLHLIIEKPLMRFGKKFTG